MRVSTTLQDIADKLDLSRTTISLALRDHPRISRATKDKVRAVAKKIGYEPNQAARSLATGRSNLIGVLVPDSTNPYYADVFRGIEDAARGADYHVILANGTYDLDCEAERMKELMSLRVSGVIAAPAFRAEKVRLPRFWDELRRSRFPLVILNRQFVPPIFHQVSDDNVSGVRMAIEALASFGHHRVAYISGIPTTVPARQRLAAFRCFARKYGLDSDHELIERAALGPRGGYEACHRLWPAVKKKPTAIMTLSDAEAIGVLRYLREQEVRVPLDVSVMGYGNFDISEYSAVSLSTISTPRREEGKQAVELLIRITHKRPACPQNIILPVRLLLRESVGPARSTRN